MEKNYVFVIPEMPSKTFVMLYKKLPDHFNTNGNPDAFVNAIFGPYALV